MTDREAMELALKTMEGIANSNWRKWEELASPEEFERWVKSRANHSAEALRQALERPSDIEAAVKKENEACAEIAYSMAYSEDETEEIAKAIRERMK